VLVDAFGRPTTDLRISVTERCNFRCVYCHNEGQGAPVRPPRDPHGDEMTPEHIERLVRVGASFGIRRVKLTGGEPLVRGDLEEIVRRCARHVDEVSLTTNGSMLESRAVGLRAAGLQRCNVSLDSLTPKDFEEIRGGQLAPVLRGVRAALDAGLKPLKINMVVYAHTVKNIEPMIEYVGRTEGLRLQLIQFMPEMAWMRPFTVDIQTVRLMLEAKADAVAERRMHHRKRYRIQGAWVEIVDPVDNPDFCAACQRLRVTADGHLKGCINSNKDLVATVGLDDDGLRQAFGRAVALRRPFYTRPGATPLVELPAR
jgi:GTP 3',8-cyclase